VSRIRTGAIDTVLLSGDAAVAPINPPAPNVTATAAPIAAHLDLHMPDRPVEFVVESLIVIPVRSKSSSVSMALGTMSSAVASDKLSR